MQEVILVICTGYFGDLILSSKLTKDIKKYFPDSKLVYICDTPYVDVAKNLPEVDDVVPYNRKKEMHPLYFLNFILKFPYKKNVKHAFIIHQNKKSRNLLAKLLGAKNIIAWEHYKEGPLYSQHLEEDFKYAKVAYINANLLSIITGCKSDDEDIEFLVTESAQQKIDDLLKTYEYSCLVGLNPQSLDPEKNWDTNEFIKFVKMLIKNGKTPVITGISNDGTSYIDAIEKDSEINKFDYINMIDKTRFEELGALYKRCSSVVSVDTGSAHMACAVGVPTLVLFFKNIADSWAPINTEQNNYIYNDGKKISAEEVYSKISSMIIKEMLV